MKKAVLSILILSFTLPVFSQHMGLKQPNFVSFREISKSVPKTLSENSSASAKSHPEYGILPHSSQCTECVELIDKRSSNSRQYINPNKPSRTFSQQSYFPLHYKLHENDIWRTIDPRLSPDVNHPGVFTAPNQPVPTKCDLNNRNTSVTERGFEFMFNNNLTMYFIDDLVLQTQPDQGNYSNFTIGQEGLRVTDMWPGITMEQVFGKGEIKTNYVIPAPLQLPISKGWMVIEDHFALPEGFSFEESPEGKQHENGYYQGDYLLKNKNGETLIVYEKPVYVDAKAWGMHGFYKLLNVGNDYTLQMFVPVDWLTRTDNTYPITIDPIVSGITKNGDFAGQGLSANMGFTSRNLGSCDYQTIVNVPGKSTLTEAYVDVEYTLTYDNMCGNPPLPAPYCTFSQVTMEVRNNACNTTTGLLACNPANPPFTGTCTTDPTKVNGASAIRITAPNFVPNYLACIPPQCPDYAIGFTLKNRDSVCLDQCGYLCARGNMWQMTIEACTVEGDITQNKTQVCAGEPVIFTANPSCGVPPYHFSWTLDGGNSFDTVYGSNTFTIYPQNDVLVYCVIYDTCGEFVQSNALDVRVVPSPPANAGSDVSLCEGGQAALGGNPTTIPNATIAWSGENGTVQSWLSATNIPNPVINVPIGTVDTFFYVLRTTDFTCFRTDTVRVFSRLNPSPVIDTSGSTSICANQNVTISVQGSYAAYQWNNGSNLPAISVNQPGDYFVICTDMNGCSDTSNVVTVSSIGLPDITVFPDTIIMYGDSVRMFTDVNLNSASVDSFRWFPTFNISCTDCPNPTVAPVSDQFYGIVVHTLGCTITDSALIRLILPNNFFIPNAFTPNGDGNNDLFYIQVQSGVEVLLFQVFDRWGEKVHEGPVPWNGMYKDKPVPQGVYVYVFKLRLFGEDSSIFRKGSLTLIR